MCDVKKETHKNVAATTDSCVSAISGAVTHTDYEHDSARRQLCQLAMDELSIVG